MTRGDTRRGCATLSIALAALALAGCGSTRSEEVRAQPGQAEVGAVDRVSNPGKPYAPSLPRDELVLRTLADDGREITRVRILGQRDGRAFYRINEECFATGPVPATAQSFDAIACAPQFPSAAQPILDFTVFHGANAADGGRPTNLRVYKSEGFAADGVAKIALVDGTDAVVAETPVVDNTYGFGRPPSGEDLRIAALSITGARIFEQPRRASSSAP